MHTILSDRDNRETVEYLQSLMMDEYIQHVFIRLGYTTVHIEPTGYRVAATLVHNRGMEGVEALQGVVDHPLAYERGWIAS